jgi:hypothetical protein
MSYIYLGFVIFFCLFLIFTLTLRFKFSQKSYKYGLGENICISLELLPPNFSSMRYDDYVFQSCFSFIETFGTVDNAINQYYSGLYKYKNDTITLLKEIIGKIDRLRVEEMSTDRIIGEKIKEVQSASNKLKELFGIISGKQGIANNLNCSFIRER